MASEPNLSVLLAVNLVQMLTTRGHVETLFNQSSHIQKIVSFEIHFFHDTAKENRKPCNILVCLRENMNTSMKIKILLSNINM